MSYNRRNLVRRGLFELLITKHQELNVKAMNNYITYDNENNFHKHMVQKV